MSNLGMILIFAVLAAGPSPTPAPSADPCGAPHSNLLAVLDRPSIGFSACAVKRREFLAEAGWANTAGSSGFLRYGAARNLEIDAILGGAFDSGFGAKYEWWHDGSRALGSDFLYTVPTGNTANTAGAPTAMLTLDYAAPVKGNLSLSSTAGLQSLYASAPDGTSARFLAFAPSLALGYQWNPRAQIFIEGFAQSRTRPDGGAQFGEDAAFQYMLTPALEIDLEAGRTANDLSRGHYAGFGFGARL